MLEEIYNRQREMRQNILKSFDSYALSEPEPDIQKSEEIIEFESFVKGYFDELEKAHNVGDIFNDYRNGKTYVYTEYQPGKFDWHVVKNKRVMHGKGINGLHGIKAVEHAYKSANKDYTDTTKMMLKRTPNGHWRMHYDGNDTGYTVDGSALTEAELINDNVCYQRNRVVDNFDMTKNYMEFNSPDDVYFVQVIKRWKDNKDKPGADAWKADGKRRGTYNSGGEYLDYYLIHSAAELDALKPQIIKACSYNNARAYISINSRSQSQANTHIAKIKSRYAQNDPRQNFVEPITYGAAKTGPNWKNERFKVLLDVDTTRDAKTTINGKQVNIWDETKKRLSDYGIKVVAEYETPSGGLHLILNNKNNRNLKPFYSGLKDFDGGRNLDRLATVHPSEDIKMVLYSNVDTEGY
jgi:hypothetical protein